MQDNFEVGPVSLFDIEFQFRHHGEHLILQPMHSFNVRDVPFAHVESEDGFGPLVCVLPISHLVVPVVVLNVAHLSVALDKVVEEMRVSELINLVLHSLELNVPQGVPHDSEAAVLYFQRVVKLSDL